MYGSNIFSIKAVFQSHCTESASWKFPLISSCYVSDSIEIFGNENNAEITVSKLRVNQFRRFRVSLDVTNVLPGQLNSIETDWSIGVSIQVSTSQFRMSSIGEWIAVPITKKQKFPSPIHTIIRKYYIKGLVTKFFDMLRRHCKYCESRPLALEIDTRR